MNLKIYVIGGYWHALVCNKLLRGAFSLLIPNLCAFRAVVIFRYCRFDIIDLLRSVYVEKRRNVYQYLKKGGKKSVFAIGGRKFV